MTDKTIFGDMTEEQIRQEAGMSAKTTPSYIVNLRTTSNHKDRNNEDKITQHLGSYNIWDKDTEQFVYAPTVSFRPFMKRQQYMTWDVKENNFSNESILVAYGEEAFDTRGTTKCGYVTAKNRNDLTPDQKETAKNTKFYRIMYGLLDMKGESSKGDKITLSQYPVQIKYAGGNAVVMSTLDSLLQNKGILWSNKVSLSTEEKTMGGNTYYNILLGKITSVDVPSNLLEDSDDGRAYQLFKNDIDAKNTSVMEKYHTSLKGIKDDKEAVSRVQSA
tara:strand:- start:2980 stop:3804 length:825 start_codon:yes stop_codon:yes gene_type:complete